MDRNVDNVIETLEKKVFYLGPVTRNKVVRAVELARSALAPGPADTKRLSENITVALIVADLQMDCDTVCAAVLKGLVGRPGCTKAQVELEVGPDVLRILEFHRTVVKSVNLCMEPSFTEMSFSNLRELILAVAADEHRAISLELARAVLQIRTLEALTDEQQKLIVARRTMYLYAPLANQLGIWYMQGELEELAFLYLKPESFHMVRHVVGERRRECESTLHKSKEFLERVLSTTPEVRSLVRTVLIKGRVKGLYSVYRKMRRSGKTVSEIYDLLALRVVVQPKKADEAYEEAACYAVANVIKQHFEMFENRAKDYISAPKRNGYRSVHLTVVPQGGSTPLEIQIRTEKMHHVAEYGKAAHWKYKSGKEDQEEAGEEIFDDEYDSGSGLGLFKDDDNEIRESNKDSGTEKSGGDMYNKYCKNIIGKETLVRMKLSDASGVSKTPPPAKSTSLDVLRSRLVSTGGVRRGRDDMQEQLRKGFVTCMASAIRTSRVFVVAAGQLYGFAVGSTLLDLAHGLGVASMGAIAVVNGSVAPLTQRLEMNDIVQFI